jgi:hypothetical protein
MLLTGFGGLAVSMLASGTQVRRSRRIFPAGKIHSLQYDTIQTTIESPIPEHWSTRYEQIFLKKPSDFFGRKNPQHAFLRKGSKAVCSVSQNPVGLRGSRIPQAKLFGRFTLEVPSFANRRAPAIEYVCGRSSKCPYTRVAWVPTGDERRHPKRRGAQGACIRPECLRANPARPHTNLPSTI